MEAWKKKNPEMDITKSEVVKLNAMFPSIEKMDSSALSSLSECEHLSLSTNQIEKMVALPGCASLKTLSLSRNNIKKIEKLEDVASTLEQLWLSYNSIDKLSGLENLSRLTTLYMSNNAIKEIAELDRIAHLTSLKDIVFLGNPIHTDHLDTYRADVIRRLPGLTNWKLDGELVTKEEIDAAKSDGAAAAE